MQAIHTMPAVRIAYRLALLTALPLVSAGCQQRPTTVAGKVTLDGEPISVASDARVTVVFHPDGGQGTTLTGLLDSSGNFRLATGASADVAPGKYQVAISIAELLPKSDEAEQSTQRITPAKYASVSESGLEANVIPGENQLSFDLKSTSVNELTAEPASDAAAPSASDPHPAEKS